MNIAISYLPITDNNGYVYKQRVTIPAQILDTFLDVLATEALNNTDLSQTEIQWLNQPLGRLDGKNVYFLNLTQGAFFKKWIVKMQGVKINKRRLIYQANMYLIAK